MLGALAYTVVVTPYARALAVARMHSPAVCSSRGLDLPHSLARSFEVAFLEVSINPLFYCNRVIDLLFVLVRVRGAVLMDAHCPQMPIVSWI